MIRRWLFGLVLGAWLLSAAQPVAAHGTGSRTDLPLPAWQMAWAAAFSVIVSFVGARNLLGQATTGRCGHRSSGCLAGVSARKVHDGCLQTNWGIGIRGGDLCSLVG